MSTDAKYRSWYLLIRYGSGDVQSIYFESHERRTVQQQKDFIMQVYPDSEVLMLYGMP